MPVDLIRADFRVSSCAVIDWIWILWMDGCRTRANALRLCQGRFRSDIWEIFFPERMDKHWNRLLGKWQSHWKCSKPQGCGAGDTV